MNNILNEVVRPLANKMLERAELPQNKQVAENCKTVFLDELKSLSYERDENGQIIVKKDGFSLTDAHGWDLTVDQVIKTVFDKYFEVSTMPINEAEYISRLKDPKITPRERIEIINYWQIRNNEKKIL